MQKLDQFPRESSQDHRSCKGPETSVSFLSDFKFEKQFHCQFVSITNPKNLKRIISDFFGKGKIKRERNTLTSDLVSQPKPVLCPAKCGDIAGTLHHVMITTREFNFRAIYLNLLKDILLSLVLKSKTHAIIMKSINIVSVLTI